MKAHRARRDANEPQVIQALERCGWTVQKLCQRNVPDLVVRRGGVTHLIEVKTRTGQLRETQQWGEDVPVLRSVDDVLTWNDSLTRTTPGAGR